jgi:hypothetical protein
VPEIVTRKAQIVITVLWFVDLPQVVHGQAVHGDPDRDPFDLAVGHQIRGSAGLLQVPLEVRQHESDGPVDGVSQLVRGSAFEKAFDVVDEHSRAAAFRHEACVMLRQLVHRVVHEPSGRS